MTAVTAGRGPVTYPTPAASVGRMFFDRVESTPQREAFRYPDGEGWTSVTWEQTADRVFAVAAGLLALGIRNEERVAILAGTSFEWIVADFGIACAGAATTTVYPSSVVDDVAYIVSDSQSRIVFAEDDDQVAKLRAQQARIPGVFKVVVFHGSSDGGWVITLDDLERIGRVQLREHPVAVQALVDSIRPDHLATLIYTSGTTGQPKGVELTQSCWTYEGAAVQALGVIDEADLQYLWLPLSHSFGKVLLAAQVQIGFSTAVDGRVDKIVENLAVVRPTLLVGVPRIFEKVHARAVQTAHGEGGLKARIFDWAFAIGRQVSRRRQQGLEPVGLLRWQYELADRLVFTKIRHRLGGNIRVMVSGSAALSPEVAEWFDSAGLTVLEGYGLTETSAGSCLNHHERNKFGTVGEPLPGTELKIASDGEVLIRGPGVMRGYHGLAEQTAEVLLADGWFATGDVGEIDEVGRLRITDRKKDVVKTSGGKYIAPGLIEAKFKALCPVASQMVVHADRRNFATALITLDPDTLAQWAESNQLSGKDYGELTQDPAVHAYVASTVDALNATLNRWETIKDFRILDHDFSIESGELTPSLKIKRKVIESLYLETLDSMYESANRR